MLVIADSCHSVQVAVLQDVVDGGEDGWLAAQEVGAAEIGGARVVGDDGAVDV